jgi:hypothetical protein
MNLVESPVEKTVNHPPYHVAKLNALSHTLGFDTPRARDACGAAHAMWTLISGLEKLKADIERGVSHYALLSRVSTLLTNAEGPSVVTGNESARR